jgi:protein TonB
MISVERPRVPKIVSIAVVGLLHAALIAALVSGLATRIVLSVPSVLHASVLDQPKPELTPPPPPPLAQPTPPSVPLPEIMIRTAEPQHTITLAVAPPHPVPFVAPQPVPVAPPASPPTGATAIGSTHTTPPYPEVSRRLGEHGLVRVAISIDASGAIQDVRVAASSGSDRLDQAAVDWVKSHWRYHPATRNGSPVASTSLAEIVFDLRNA